MHSYTTTKTSIACTWTISKFYPGSILTMYGFFLFFVVIERTICYATKWRPKKGSNATFVWKKTPNKLKQNICLINFLFFRLLTLGKVEDSQHKKCKLSAGATDSQWHKTKSVIPSLIFNNIQITERRLHPFIIGTNIRANNYLIIHEKKSFNACASPIQIVNY